MQNDDDGTDQANSTAQLSQRAKLLIQEIGSQHGADQDTESSQRSHQDSRGKSVGGEIADFSDANCREVLESDCSYSTSAPVAHELQFLPTTWGFSCIQIHRLRSRVALQLVIIPVHVVSREVLVYRLGRLSIVCR